LYAFNALHTDYAAGVHQTESARTRRRDLMLDGAYAPGRRLTEAEVAESPTMSRTPVREAFRTPAAGLAADPVAPAAPDRLGDQLVVSIRAPLDPPHRPAQVTAQHRELLAAIAQGRAADAAPPARRHIDDIRGGAPATAPERT
jgi:DNA-binding GntR family transcriptional regulator